MERLVIPITITLAALGSGLYFTAIKAGELITSYIAG